MMNGDVLSSHESLFGLGRRLGSESSSEEQLYSCSSSSEASVYLDVEPYFGDVDFHDTCSGYAFPRLSVQPKRPPISEKYIAKAAQLVGSLSLEKKRRKEEKQRKADVEEFMLLYNEEKCDDDEEEAEAREDDVDDRREEPKLRKASSLKSPGVPLQPGEKKIVRFADVLGLDLADIRTFLDEIPKVPRSAFKDLEGVEVAASPPVSSFLFGSSASSSTSSMKDSKAIVPLFRVPPPEFMERLRSNSVCLESASTATGNLSGLISVLNIGYHKTVTVRTSTDSWRSSADVEAEYVPDSCNGFSDKFKFTLPTESMKIGDRLEFAIKYTCNGTEHWDNNGDSNYIIQCLPYEGSNGSAAASCYLPPSPAFSQFGNFY